MVGENLFNKITNRLHVVSLPSLVRFQMMYKLPFVTETGRLLFLLNQIDLSLNTHFYETQTDNKFYTSRSLNHILNYVKTIRILKPNLL
jgi:hypothetical protein